MEPLLNYGFYRNGQFNLHGSEVSRLRSSCHIVPGALDSGAAIPPSYLNRRLCSCCLSGWTLGLRSFASRLCRFLFFLGTGASMSAFYYFRLLLAAVRL